MELIGSWNYKELKKFINIDKNQIINKVKIIIGKIIINNGSEKWVWIIKSKQSVIKFKDIKIWNVSKNITKIVIFKGYNKLIKHEKNGKY
jgi:hypothetical protein